MCVQRRCVQSVIGVRSGEISDVGVTGSDGVFMSRVGKPHGLGDTNGTPPVSV